MRINRFEIKDFGKFTGGKTIDNIDSRVALFYGRNEAGKTTIFNLIKSVMYGFFPAKSNLHPYSSWENGRIEFTAHITTDDGEIAVYRKLLSKPQGRYVIGENSFNIKNESLPMNSHISKEIYDKIYSLQVEDLIEIQGKAWEEVEDKLLANYGTTTIRNTRDALKDLKEECEKIWRESGRGKYLVKELENEIRQLKKMKKEAYVREDEIRKADRRIIEIEARIRELKEDKIELRTLLNKAKELVPIKKKLEQLNRLNDNLIKEDLCLSLPHNIREKSIELKRDLEEIKDRKSRTIKILNEKKDEIYPLTTMDKLILENKVKINTLSKDYEKIENMEESINKVKHRIARLRDRIFHESKNLLTEKWSNRIRERFENINKSELKILVSNYKNAAHELHEAKLKREMKVANEFKISLSKSYIYSLILSLILIAMGFLRGNNIFKTVGIGILTYGMGGIIGYINMKKTLNSNAEREELDRLNEEVYRLRERLKLDREKLKAYLAEIPISSLIIENMDEMFLPSLMGIKDMVYELKELEKELDIYSSAHMEKRKDLNDFLSQFIFDIYINEDGRIFLLRDRLEDLEKRVLINENIDKEILALEKDIKLFGERYREIESVLKDHNLRLNEIGDGKLERGLNIVEKNYRLRTKIHEIMEELNEGDKREVLVKEVRKHELENPWIFSDYETLRSEEELEEINQSLKELEVERARLEENINRLSEGCSLDEIESRLILLEDDLERASKKRDRLALLSEVIKLSDEKFKEENQPDILKNGGKYFRTITNNRYTNIFLDEYEECKNIMVKELGETVPKRVVGTFSKGTLNQLYLALRLSLIDYLDRDREALPICFDELLINWDGLRLNSSLKLLDEISERRQIFIFTCHDWMAEKIEKSFNVERIEL
ncbi:MAG: AAA family ATPase [Clostridia bacterium]|nr:AAA family ATPase [Clostridia bacterium]